MNQRELMDIVSDRAAKIAKTAADLCSEVGELYGNGGLIHKLECINPEHKKTEICAFMKDVLYTSLRGKEIANWVEKRTSGVQFNQTDLIGQCIIKRSVNPFKGGDKIVTATGIRLHPNERRNPKLEGVLVFTYDYLDKEVGGIAQSYVECRRVRRATAIDMQRHVLDPRP